jgi:predicted transcriptional regulator
MKKEMKTISQYAKEKGITRQAVLKRIKKDKLKAIKVGNIWIIIK